MRPRLLAGLHKIPLKICIIQISDFDTPQELVGKKVVPILQKDDDSCMTESLDIAFYLDSIRPNILVDDTINPNFELLKQTFLNDYIRLTSPHFIHSCREFQNEDDIKYYQEREEDFLKTRFADLHHDYEKRKLDMESRLPSFIPFLSSPSPTESLTVTELSLFPFVHHLKTQVDINLPPSLHLFWQQLSPYIPV